VGLFRKKETLNEQMLREAGLDRVVFNTPQSPIDAGPLPGATGDIGPSAWAPGPRDWDAVTSIEAPGIQGGHVDFTTLPNGDLILGSADGDGDLAPLADAIEEHIAPPYRAIATRQDGDLWGVGAKRIEVELFQFPNADALELTHRDGVVELRVNGEPSDAAVPETVQSLGERAGPDFCVEARRIDGDYWEVEVSQL